MKKFTRLSILLALSVALNILETALPLFETNIPGLRLGLANIVTLFIIYQYDLKDAFYVGILRVFLVGILRTGLFSTTFFFMPFRSDFKYYFYVFGKEVFKTIDRGR